MDLREIGWEIVDWSHLAQERDQWQALVNTNEPSGSIQGRELLEKQSDYKLLKKDCVPWC
jgi:hypothetical protein